MNSAAAGKPPAKPRRSVWKIAGLAIALAVASLLLLAYAGERFYRYVAGIPDDTVMSRTTAKPGMLLERRGYDFTVPGEDWHYRYDQSGLGQIVELRRPEGDELDGGFLYAISVIEWVVEEGPVIASPAARFAKDRDTALGRSPNPAFGVTRLETGLAGDVLVTEGADQDGRAYVNRIWIDRVLGPPCYAQHVRRSAEWRGNPVLTENFTCSLSHPDSRGRYVLTVTYSETGAPSRQPTRDGFINRVVSALAHMTLRELDSIDIAQE